MKRVCPVVKLISHTPNPEEVIATSAKLCYSDKNIEEILQQVQEKDTSKFISLLLSLGHLSPIEHASFTFSIEGVSRSFLAQITRHRIASFSVKSQRYVSAGNGFDYILPPQIEQLGAAAIDEYEKQMVQISKWYEVWQQKLGGASEKANEDARFVLPNAAETKMTLTMNARELMHFFSLRCCNRAQWEIRDVAWQMLELCLQVAPNLFSNSGAACVAGVCSEGKMSCKNASEVRQRMAALKEKKV